MGFLITNTTYMTTPDKCPMCLSLARNIVNDVCGICNTNVPQFIISLDQKVLRKELKKIKKKKAPTWGLI